MTGWVIRQTFATHNFGQTSQQHARLAVDLANATRNVRKESTLFVTYENTHNPHVTVHRDNCGQVRKRGGVHKHAQGRYKNHDSFVQAVAYAHSTGLPVINCSYCKLPASCGSAHDDH